MNVYWITSLLIYFNLKFKQYIILIVNILSMNFIYDSIAPGKKEKGRILHKPNNWDNAFALW